MALARTINRFKFLVSPTQNAFKRTTLPLIQHACNASGANSSSVSPIYELRMYKITAKDFKIALDTMTKYKDVRTSHSEMFGYWTSEIGDTITQFVHLWKYDSLSQRREVRTNMSKDVTWTTEFIPKFMPCVQKWVNVLVAPMPGSEVNTDFTNQPSAVYVLQKVTGPVDLKSAPVTIGAEELLVGRFLGLLGPAKTEYRLWRYGNIDAATEASYTRAVESPTDGSTLLMYPASFSPIQ